MIKGLSPYTLYIPSKEIMLKMMRSCIKVKKVENLWFQEPVPPPKEEEDGG